MTLTLPLASWLALREPADVAARSAALADAVAARLGGVRPLRIVDLGTGTGSNVRYFAPRLPDGQEWLIVDRDPGLLAEARRRMPDLTIQTRAADLGQLEAADVIA